MTPQLRRKSASIEVLRSFARRTPPIRSAHRWFVRRREQHDVRGVAKGLRLVVPGRFADPYLNRPYEPFAMSWLERLLGPGSIAVDVGAHVGFVTCLLARSVAPGGRVVAVEPFPENVSYIRRNLAANGLDADVIEAGAGATTGRRELHVTGSSDSHGFFPHPLTDTRRLIDVRQVRLDDLLPTADVVKIDAEGAECEVLEGMHRLLSSRPYLLVEWNPACQASARRRDDELVATLIGLGYDVSVLDDLTGARRQVEEILRALRAGDLPRRWYANLACSFPGRAGAHAGVYAVTQSIVR